jgi:hypothetical protein
VVCPRRGCSCYLETSTLGSNSHSNFSFKTNRTQIRSRASKSSRVAGPTQQGGSEWNNFLLCSEDPSRVPSQGSWKMFFFSFSLYSRFYSLFYFFFFFSSLLRVHFADFLWDLGPETFSALASRYFLRAWGACRSLTQESWQGE